MAHMTAERRYQCRFWRRCLCVENALSQNPARHLCDWMGLSFVALCRNPWYSDSHPIRLTQNPPHTSFVLLRSLLQKVSRERHMPHKRACGAQRQFYYIQVRGRERKAAAPAFRPTKPILNHFVSRALKWKSKA